MLYFQSRALQKNILLFSSRSVSGIFVSHPAPGICHRNGNMKVYGTQKTRKSCRKVSKEKKTALLKRA